MLKKNKEHAYTGLEPGAGPIKGEGNQRWTQRTPLAAQDIGDGRHATSRRQRAWTGRRSASSGATVSWFFFSSRRRHTRSVSAFLLNRSSDLHLEGVASDNRSS